MLVQIIEEIIVSDKKVSGYNFKITNGEIKESLFENPKLEIEASIDPKYDLSYNTFYNDKRFNHNLYYPVECINIDTVYPENSFYQVYNNKGELETFKLETLPERIVDESIGDTVIYIDQKGLELYKEDFKNNSNYDRYLEIDRNVKEDRDITITNKIKELSKNNKKYINKNIIKYTITKFYKWSVFLVLFTLIGITKTYTLGTSSKIIASILGLVSLLLVTFNLFAFKNSWKDDYID